MEKGLLIGVGRTAEVYEWGPDKIIKLYFDWANPYMFNKEIENTLVVNHLKLPSPYLHEVLDLEGRKGLVYDRIQGPTLLVQMQSKPLLIARYAKIMASIHHHIHQSVTDKLTPGKSMLEYTIREVEQKGLLDSASILERLKKLPDSQKVCHGDFHPDNVLIGNGEHIAIDWMNAYAGNPACDVARTLLILKSPYIAPGLPKLLQKLQGIAKGILYHTYLKTYTRLSGITLKQINDWLIPVAAARLIEEVPGEQEWLKKIVTENLSFTDI